MVQIISNYSLKWLLIFPTPCKLDSSNYCIRLSWNSYFWAFFSHDFFNLLTILRLVTWWTELCAIPQRENAFFIKTQKKKNTNKWFLPWLNKMCMDFDFHHFALKFHCLFHRQLMFANISVPHSHLVRILEDKMKRKKIHKNCKCDFKIFLIVRPVILRINP